jgi:RNA polymerase sigma-70 factor (ECF subfamily)
VQQATNINVDESVLVELCRRGDSGATERLILRYQKRIYNAILRICANSDDAAELTQEVFVKVIENIDGFEGRSSFYTWIFRIAVNLALNYCSRNIRIGKTSLDSFDDEHIEQRADALKSFLSDESSPDPAVVAADRELGRLALKALEKLDDSYRAVIVLRDIEGLNYAQIAEVLDIELGTVKSRLSRARNSLRQILEAFLR